MFMKQMLYFISQIISYSKQKECTCISGGTKYLSHQTNLIGQGPPRSRRNNLLYQKLIVHRLFLSSQLGHIACRPNTVTSSMTDGHASGTDKEPDMEMDYSVGVDGDGSDGSADLEYGLQGSPAAAMGCTSPTISIFSTTNLGPYSSIHQA